MTTATGNSVDVTFPIKIQIGYPEDSLEHIEIYFKEKSIVVHIPTVIQSDNTDLKLALLDELISERYSDNAIQSEVIAKLKKALQEIASQNKDTLNLLQLTKNERDAYKSSDEEYRRAYKGLVERKNILDLELQSLKKTIKEDSFSQSIIALVKRNMAASVVTGILGAIATVFGIYCPI